LRAASIALAHKAADPNEADRVRIYFSLLGVTFGEALLRATETIMINGEVVTRWVEDQRRQGMIEGIAKGKAEGKAEGEAAGMAKAVLAILSKRGLAFSAEQQDAVLSCTDLERLNQWVARALAIESVDELLAGS
jgi:flagellar biosynthesis/type III secretory pathway protein FliH